MRTWSFAKGHGTGNDFVLMMDRSGLLNPSDNDVRFLCDRRCGIGGDGVLRAVKAEQIPTWTGDPDLWFMDYRNADGSIAEICANGLRVFIRWLIEEDLADGSGVDIATRAGLRHGQGVRDSLIRVDVGCPTWSPTSTTVELGGVGYQGNPVDVGNPHCVVRLNTLEELENLDLSVAPVADGFTQGVNVEFVVATSPGHLTMRVYERGVGETLSCGTGVVAASVNAAHHDPGEESQTRTYVVEVPGGHLTVDLVDNQALLTGPAVILARGKVNLPSE
ncbi:MAG: diaminopimelate epimerase [Propionibacteriaceae bacterium]|nr:diaminopimelate epimerase [Propionibacteriaceae bacterium]